MLRLNATGIFLELFPFLHAKAILNKTSGIENLLALSAVSTKLLEPFVFERSKNKKVFKEKLILKENGNFFN